MSKKGRLLFAASVLSLLALAGLFFALRVWMPFMWIVLLTSLGSLAGWLILDRKILGSFMAMKATKHGMNMGVLVLLAIVMLTAINYAGAKWKWTFDFSSNGVNTLSDQSVKVLSSLDSDLDIKFFYKNGAENVEDEKRRFRELVKHYQDKSTRIKFEMVEINERPKLAQDFGASKGTGEAFLEYKGNKNRIENYAEQDFTNAVIKVTRTKKKNIYFLEGHGERSIDDEKDEKSIFGFRQMLEKNSYEVKKINLVKEQKIPADADVLIIAAPTQQLQTFEVKGIADYLVRGGNLLLMLDEKKTFGLESILKVFGLELEPHYVYNVFSSPMGKVVNAQAATVAVDYSLSNPITKMFTTNQMVLFRNPHSFRLSPIGETINREIIVRTPDSSVALQELDSQDYSGTPRSFDIVAQIRGKMPESMYDFNAIVFADADFLSNILLYQNINRDLALNAVADLSKETDLISVAPKEPLMSKMLVSPPEFNQFFKFTVVGIFLPLPVVFMILSIVLWYRRRHA